MTWISALKVGTRGGAVLAFAVFLYAVFALEPEYALIAGICCFLLTAAAALCSLAGKAENWLWCKLAMANER